MAIVGMPYLQIEPDPKAPGHTLITVVAAPDKMQRISLPDADCPNLLATIATYLDR